MNSSPADITTDPQWQAEQTDRLIAWECLQCAIGGGGREVNAKQLADKLALPGTFLPDMLKKIKRRHNAKT